MARGPLTLTILGSSPAAPNAGGACSGYLVQTGERAVLLDCGSGVVGHLRQHREPRTLDAVVLSHFHADHYFDLIPLYYTLRFGQPRAAGRLPLHVPPGGVAHLRRFGHLVSGQEDMLDDQLAVREYAPGPPHTIGPFTFHFTLVQHYIPSFAMRISLDGGPTLVFSADVAPCDALVEAAQDADLLLCEAAILSPDQDEPDPARRGHSTPAEAGAMARRANARRLLLTHYRRGAPELQAQHRAAAGATYGGPVELAEEGQTYSIGGT